MVFVCTGTQVYQFNRLLEEIDRLIQEGIIVDEVFAQIGASTYVPKCYKYERFIGAEDYHKILNEATLIISHGGTGALIGALKLGKNVIAVPRLRKYGEHTDGHQLQIVQVLESQKYIRAVYDINELSGVYLEAISNPISNVYNRESYVLQIIDDYIRSQNNEINPNN